jgi:V8-like Glu-specific endopeptidase
MRKFAIVMVTLGLLGWATAERAPAQPVTSATQVTVWQYGTVTELTVSNPKEHVGDFVNARPMELPRAPGRSAAEARQDLIDALMRQPLGGQPGQPVYSPGATGDGTTEPIELGVPSASPANPSGDVPAPLDLGTGNIAFTTAQADLKPTATNQSYPYRPTGKLTFTTPTGGASCSASLIRKGLVVTAAHCVALFGSGKFYSKWQFAPGYRNGTAPYGLWTVTKAYVLTAYLNGTDSCANPGVICQDDIGILVLKAKSGAYPGTKTGWYGYAGWSGLPAQVTQLGYPGDLDNGLYMERTDSPGYTSSSCCSNDTLIGTLMGKGSSGGPWLVNFGKAPTLTGAVAGPNSGANILIGVTSFGFLPVDTAGAPLESGASPLLHTNIDALVTTACTAFPGAC